MAFRGSAILEVNPTCISFPSTASGPTTVCTEYHCAVLYHEWHLLQSVCFFFLVYFMGYTIETIAVLWLRSQELSAWHSFIPLFFRFYHKGLITYQCWCHMNYIKMKNLHENKSSALCAKFHMTSEKIISFLYDFKFLL